MPYRFIDSHCHLDAIEFTVDIERVRERARAQGVDLCLIPSVDRPSFQRVSELAHLFKDVYALGIHPLFTTAAVQTDIELLKQMVSKARKVATKEAPFRDLEVSDLQASNLQASDLSSLSCSNELGFKDPRLIAIGEIGLDKVVPGLDWSRQVDFYEQQLKIAADFDLPVVLHVRGAVDFILKGLRKITVKGGIAHAFNGSLQQAHQLIELGFKLGFGGALTYPRALHLRKLAKELPLESIVLETDSPDIVPSWLYVNADRRAGGEEQGRNEPCEIPKIAAELCSLRGIEVEELMHASTANFVSIFNSKGF